MKVDVDGNNVRLVVQAHTRVRARCVRASTTPAFTIGQFLDYHGQPLYVLNTSRAFANSVAERRYKIATNLTEGPVENCHAAIFSAAHGPSVPSVGQKFLQVRIRRRTERGEITFEVDLRVGEHDEFRLVGFRRHPRHDADVPLSVTAWCAAM